MRGRAAETHRLQDGEAGGALDVGQGIGRGSRQAREGGARGEGEVKLAGEFIGVFAGDAEQVDDIAIDVIEDFGACAQFAAQEDAAHAGAGFGIAAMGGCGDACGDDACEPAFAAELGGDGLCCGDGGEFCGCCGGSEVGV